MALESILKSIFSKLMGNKSTSAGEMIKDVINEVINPDQPQQPSAQAQQPRYDEVEQSIAQDGYVWQSRLWRRHVMAQMFRLLHGKHDLPMSEANYDKCVGRRRVGYSWRMLLDELYAQSRLWLDDKEQFAERNRWFNKAVVEDMARQLNNADGAELLKRLQKVETPEQLYKSIRNVDWDRGMKSEAWKNAYKGAGAYFTMKNLILFHNCNVHLDTGEVLDRDASFKYLTDLNNNPLTTGHDLFAVMMKLINDNNFDWRH